jgi:hypothetical protein
MTEETLDVVLGGMIAGCTIVMLKTLLFDQLEFALLPSMLATQP